MIIHYLFSETVTNLCIHTYIALQLSQNFRENTFKVLLIVEIDFTKKGLVYFQEIRATWHKKFSVIATVKPSIPPNRVFSGSTFDFT